MASRIIFGLLQPGKFSCAATAAIRKIQEVQLKATPRQPLGKRSRRLIREGKVPAIVYGHNTEPTPVTLDRLEFQKVFARSGRTHLVDLVLDGDGAKTEKVLVREIQTHPRR